MTIDVAKEQCDKPLPYDFAGLTNELRLKAKNELHESEENIKQCLRIFKDMLKEEKDLVVPKDDDYLMQYLRSRKYDVKRALQTLKNFYNARRKYHEIYDDFDFRVVQKTMDAKLVGFLPYRDSEGCAILIINAGLWNPQEVSMAEVMATLTSGLLHAITHPATQVAGFKVIADFKGFGFGHVAHLDTKYIWLFADALQNCFPGRFRAIHVVNEGFFCSYVWVVLKQLLTKKLKERFQFHGKNTKKLHKYFSADILPKEYEGGLGPFDTSAWARSMKDFEGTLIDIYGKYGYKKKSRSEEN